MSTESETVYGFRIVEPEGETFFFHDKPECLRWYLGLEETIPRAEWEPWTLASERKHISDTEGHVAHCSDCGQPLLPESLLW